MKDNEDLSPDLANPQEVVLELVDTGNGEVALRKNGEEEALVTIRFSSRVQEMLGEQLGTISQNMIQAALYTMAEQQVARWHARVYDEQPKQYS